MIAASWTLSTVISIPPLFGLKDPDIDEDEMRGFSGEFHQAGTLVDTGRGSFNPLVISSNHVLENEWEDDWTISQTTDGSGLTNETNSSDDMMCVISQNLGYTVFSTVGAFYLPLTFIIAVYLNVYRVARSRIHRRQFNRRRDDDHRVGQRDASTIDPDIDTTMQPSGIVMRALRSRLSAISLGLPSTRPSPSASSVPLNRVVSLNYRRCASTADDAERSISSQPQQQHLLQPPSQHQFLSVNSSSGLSESNSALSSAASSRAGSLIYFTRFSM